MTKLTYSYTMGGNSIDAAIPMLAKSVATLNTNVQKLIVSLLADFKKSGDKPTAVRRANEVVKALGKGMRANSLQGWFEQNAPMVYNKETKLLVAGCTGMSPVKDHTKIDLAVSTAALWYDAVAEQEYKPLEDWTKMLTALVKRAKDDLKHQGTKSKVDLAQLAVLEGMAAHRPLSEVIGVVNTLDTLKADIKVSVDPLA